MANCEKCGYYDSLERPDIKGSPVLCDKCYGMEKYGIDCDICNNSYYMDNVLYCNLEVCNPDCD